MRTLWRQLSSAAALLLVCGGASAQGTTGAAQEQNAAERLEALNRTLVQAETQMERLETQLRQVQAEMDGLRQQISTATPPSTVAPSPAPSAIEDIQEQQQVQQAEIATQEQIKVESVSKLPVRVSGLVLLNGFVNTRQTDNGVVPTLAETGSGSTGLSVRQTVLALTVGGPHLWGASSGADVSADFFGGQYQGGGYVNQDGFLRLRTAQGTMDWTHTRLFVALDRPVFSPYSPSSLTAIASPPLAWSGNLWNWIPAVGVRHDVALTSGRSLRLETSLLDVPDAPSLPGGAASGASANVVSLAENSRWPSLGSRISLLGSGEDRLGALGVGGYFSPHRSGGGERFNAWAVTADVRLSFPARLQATGSFYRGQALGGLGGGTYKDFVYQPNGTRLRVLDDVGGWLQLKERWNARLEFNAAAGADNAFSGELALQGVVPALSFYQQLARNRTLFVNAIYSPSTYLSFSAEYRRILSSPVTGNTLSTDVAGVAAGFSF